MFTQRIFVHDDLLRQAIENFSSNKPLLVYGAFGSGKATFIDRFIAEFGKKEPHVFWVRLDFNQFPADAFNSAELFWKNFIIIFGLQTESDLAEINDYWEENLEYVFPEQATLNFIGETLEKLKREVILVIENTHLFNDDDLRNSFFNALRSSTQEHKTIFDEIKIAASMISDGDEINELNEGSPFTNIAERIQLLPAGDEQIARLLKSYGFDSSPDTIDKIKALIGGNLYFITILLEYASTNGNDVRALLARSNVEEIFSEGLNTVSSHISAIQIPAELVENGVKSVLEILSEFRSRESISIQENNTSRIIYDKIARTGIMYRVRDEWNINYKLQGSLFRVFIYN
jgi:GTPase SAR1 family protein